MCVCARECAHQQARRRRSIFISHTHPSPLTCTRLISTTLLQLPFFCAKLSRRTGEKGKKLDPRCRTFQARMCGLKKRSADNEMDFQRALSAPPALYCHNLCCCRRFVCLQCATGGVSRQTFCQFAKCICEHKENLSAVYQI